MMNRQSAIEPELTPSESSLAATSSVSPSDASTDTPATLSGDVECAHCGLPAPASQDGSPSFCCAGCRGAFALIHDWGLADFYQLRDATGGEVSELSDRVFEDLDKTQLLGRSAPIALSDSESHRVLQSTLAISGLHCAACSWLIERLPQHIDGWVNAEVNLYRRTISIVFDPSKTRLSAIARVLHNVGYDVSPLPDSATVTDQSDQQSRQMLINVAFGGFCAANAMWIAVALYAGEFTGMAASHAQFLRIAGVVLGAIAVAFPGRVFLRSALASLRTRTPHMDLPIALGLTVGLAASIWAVFTSRGEVYFDSLACLVFFLLTGRWLQMRQQRRAGEAVEELVRVSPPLATRVVDGRHERVRSTELSTGDRVWVAAGESVPVDGVILEGRSFLDRSLLTGESCPVEVTDGDLVEAGTDNLQSPLLVQVTAPSGETKLASMTESVARAAAQRTPVVQLANRIGAWFVMVVLALAIGTGILWWMIDPSRAAGNVVALLIVACPCALALATPLAIAVSIGRLARRGILVRSGDAVERLSKPGTVFFDKTGTLTQGRMAVRRWFGDRYWLRDIAAIEASLQHPIATAIREFATRQQPSDPRTPTVSRVDHRIGYGVAATVDGARYRIGSPRWIRPTDTVEPERQRQIEQVIECGETPVVVMVDGVCQAVLGVSDPIRDDAPVVIKRLRDLGWQTRIVSGDHQRAVSVVGQRLGLEETDAVGGLLPEEKLAAIEEERQTLGERGGAVVMVGDGVNDAAALAAADVGIAIRGGARASLAAAPIVIRSGQLSGILDALQTAGTTQKTIRRNFAASLAYNGVAVTLAIAGWITPLVAAALMPASSLTVLGLTMASRRPTDKGNS